jgi:carbamoyl-phosphate synthase large subunit
VSLLQETIWEEMNMSINLNIKKVLVIGSGPIVIGQAAEFDYSGTQACQGLKEEGIEVVLVNSNPATIMTDKEVADRVYIEPLEVGVIEKIIEKERPDGLIAGMGGQTGLNLAVELSDKGILEKYNVKVLGTSIESIKKGEDRELFRNLMKEINEPVIESEIVNDLDKALEFAMKEGYPLVVRPAYTMGGAGGGIAENEEELMSIVKSGLLLSPVKQVLVEKCIRGWKEIEYEVMRDRLGNKISVCNMENIDPVGIHTGDSIVVAPSQTLADKEYQMLRNSALKILEAVGVQGGCNVQFALHPDSKEYVIIEINPRVSRSSALASKATGYPIAKVAAKIALGYTLDEIKNSVTEKTYACFEPSLDYVVVKIPKWPFDKFKDANKRLGTKMMATGEVMAIGNNLESAFLKAVRSLEIGRYSLVDEEYSDISLQELKEKIQVPDDERIFYICEMIRRAYRVEKVAEITGIDKFFVKKLKNIIDEEETLREMNMEDLTEEKLYYLKKIGFSDKALGKLLKVETDSIYQMRLELGIVPAYKMVDTCAAEFEALSPYYYSTYDKYDEVVVSDKKKVVVVGSGPIRIGQGIEFDYCSVHSILALKKLGYETIIINNNPETVSTDFNISDKLYFEPLTEEDVLNIIDKEKPEGVILQFGGQTSIKLAKFLNEKNVKILGTSYDNIDRAEDRERFEELLDDLDINRPKGKAVFSTKDGLLEGEKLGYPLLVRPSYVLGGMGMEITHNPQELEKYLENAFKRDKKNPVLIDKYLVGKEIEIDAICDGDHILIPGIMEHLERAGVHSGDSITIFPSNDINDHIKNKIIEYTEKIGKGLNAKGMINIQFIESNNELYVIEVNPRSSRTVPYISKVSDVPVIDIATRVVMGQKLKDLEYGIGLYKRPELISVKVPVFSTSKLPDVEVSLGPEMRSTGEVLGVGRTLEEALYKGFLGANFNMKCEKKKVLATVKDEDKGEFLEIAKLLDKLGYEFISTSKTYELLKTNNLSVQKVDKLKESDELLTLINKDEIHMVINTPTKGNDSKRDGFKIRRKAIESNVNIFTCIDTFRAYVEVLEFNKDSLKVFNL